MVIPTTMSDLPGIWHASVLGRFDEGNPPAGGVGLSRAAAEMAALGEALERYAAATYPLPRVPRAQCDPAELLPLESFSLFDEAQRAQDGFPFADLYGAGAGELEYTDVFSLVDNSRRRAPAVLVGLSGDPHGIATSSGLAAGRSRYGVLLRALQELVERDALMTTWNHCLPGRRVALPARWRDLIDPLGGRVWAFDLTPLYSPHPVAAVCGSLPARGRPRIAIGSACRSSWAEAVDKAFLEWAQGILYAGFFLARNPGKRFRNGSEVVTFADHAAYYSVHPEQWERVPLHSEAFDAPAPPDSPDWRAPAAQQLEALVSALAAQGIGLYYRDLTTLDLDQAGTAVVRVLSADLAPIHADQRWPYIGGRSRELAWRYPVAPVGPFPNPLPHPLG
jgi:ribosomal protein S12 methylthiotransferase accessory factor